MNTTKKVLVLLALVASAGCQRENASSVVIRGRAFPEISETGCSWSPDGQVSAIDGKLDVSAEYSDQLRYMIELYLRNDMAVPNPPANESGKDFRAEAARVRLNPPDFVDTHNPDPALLPVSLENTVALTGQVVEAGGGLAVEVISNAITHDLGVDLQNAGIPAGESRKVVLGITLQGHTLDGEYLETNEWPYGITVCNGCMPRLTDALCLAQFGPGFVAVRSSCYPPGQDIRYQCVAGN